MIYNNDNNNSRQKFAKHREVGPVQLLRQTLDDIGRHYMMPYHAVYELAFRLDFLAYFADIWCVVVGGGGKPTQWISIS